MIIQEIPFSRRGAFQVVSPLRNTTGLFLRDVRGGDSTDSRIFELLIDGESVDFYNEKFNNRYDVQYREAYFSIKPKNSEGLVEFIFPLENQLRIKVTNLNVKLKADKVRYDTLNKMGKLKYEYISYKKEARYRLTFKEDSYKMDAPWYRVGNEHIVIEFKNNELIIEDYKTVLKSSDVYSTTFEEDLKTVEKLYKKWEEDNALNIPNNFILGQRKANYIIWSSIVRAEQNLTEESIYMSKNWMQNIWSWDNCFNAMAQSKRDKNLAYGQFKIFIDHQDKESGQYPDYINDRFYSYSCAKPPIHAWAYALMMKDDHWFAEEKQLRPIFESIVKTSLFWVNHMSLESGSSYYTHGNDSGWDNATIFHEGLPVVAPDLQAHLIRQFDILSEWADILNEPEMSKTLKGYANLYFDKLMEKNYDGTRFYAYDALTKEKIKNGNSLILKYPLVIHNRLNDTIVEQLMEDIIEDHLLPYGLATEGKSSEYFTTDGYWLGPIWAPSSYLFFDAIRSAGYEEIALDIAKRFLELGLIGGMAENYNALTGEGNDDRSFTWTSSVYLLLGDYVHEKEE